MDPNDTCRGKVKIHNFVSLYDMVPRLLGRYLPDTMRVHMHYVHPSLSFAAENFTPFGNFHVMSQTQMQSTNIDSHYSQGADMNALQLTEHQEEKLNALIGAHTLEGVIMLAHD